MAFGGASALVESRTPLEGTRYDAFLHGRRNKRFTEPLAFPVVMVIRGSRAVAAGVAPHHFVVPVMAHAAQSDVPATLLSVYAPGELALLAMAGLLIAAAGTLGPASWVARIRTATALRAE
jgi:hypothetical protein